MNQRYLMLCALFSTMSAVLSMNTAAADDVHFKVVCSTGQESRAPNSTLPQKTTAEVVSEINAEIDDTGYVTYVSDPTVSVAMNDHSYVYQTICVTVRQY